MVINFRDPYYSLKFLSELEIVSFKRANNIIVNFHPTALAPVNIFMIDFLHAMYSFTSLAILKLLENIHIFFTPLNISNT